MRIISTHTPSRQSERRNSRPTPSVYSIHGARRHSTSPRLHSGFEAQARRACGQPRLLFGVCAGPSSPGSSAVMLQPASPLTARSLENVPYYDPKPRATPKTVLSELPRSTDEEDRAAWSAAPRIRAKLTPAATPRRKAADVHGSHRAHVGAASPASATAHKPSFAVAPATPQAASLVLPPPPSSPSRRTQPTSDPESVAVCVR